MFNIVVFGAPGSGKGTQSDAIKSHFNLYHISTGDVLRQEIALGTDTGKIAKECIDAGQLVPDDIIIEVLAHVLDKLDHQDGVIFDGFPRTVVQAEALDKMLGRRGQKVDALVDLQVPEDLLVERLLNRGKISGRSDDNEEAIRQRLEVYRSRTIPVMEYYKAMGKHIPINGVGDINEISQGIITSLETKLNKRN
ncbi:adenylate kinase [Porphyromonas sp.]|uniref:adenylate kinase n=1 Tax=Porphyromonas sp. TaxID=1924944 RepID=UPI0026DCC603|nr:adenylate kinase [Porphyromonas sp.]MDO4695716.1 adenylate kinase [Porphyromonas sp.]MDO4771104.1 adenylate kinase [Porphyromonas sp.]